MIKKYYNIENHTLIPVEDENAAIHIIIDPNSNELDEIEKNYNIDKHTLVSALDPDEVPRLELEDEYNVVIWKRPRRIISTGGSFIFEVSSMGFFIFKDKLLILLSEDIPLLEKRFFHKVFNLNDVFLKILSRSIAHFLDHLKVIDEISSEIKKKVNTSMENKYLLQMFDLSESLVYYLNAINANGSVLEKMRINTKKMNFLPEDLETLDDVIIENNQCYKQAEIFSTILTGLMDARGSVVNNNVNALLKRLTVINTIFLPLNLIASIGGMSEYSVWTQSIPWYFAYSLLLLLMIIIGIVTMIIIDPSILKKEK